MKTCPKCNSSDVLRLKNTGPGDMITTNVTVFGAVYLKRFVCVACGYSEQYLENPEDREKLRNRHQPE